MARPVFLVCRPWLIHCSAGIGRTGTFIGVDSGMQLIDKLNAVDTAMLIEHMRRDRGGMVQTKDQYEFLYNVLKAYHAEKVRAKRAPCAVIIVSVIGP